MKSTAVLKRPSLLLLFGLVGTGCSDSYDVLIRGGTIVDGTGAPTFVADVAIEGDRVVAVGDVEGQARITIDATGLMVTPGFIDMHSHSEEPRLVDGAAPSFSLQGITTEIFGETDSHGPVGGLRDGPYLPDGSLPGWTTLGGFLDTLATRGSAANFASYVGSGAVRAIVMGYDDREPTETELAEMRKLVRDAMAEGALGVSSGMSYVPNSYQTTEELTTLVREAAASGGIYATHARTMNGTDPEAIREAVRIAEDAGAGLHFFHLNSTSSTSASEFLGIIRDARARGLAVTGDTYTYTWGITGLVDYIPAWALVGGMDALVERLQDRETRKRIAVGFVNDPPYLANIGWHHVRFGVLDERVNAKLVSEVAAIREWPPEEVFMDVVLEQVSSGNCKQLANCIVIDWNNEEATLQEVIAEPFVGGGTDGWTVDLDSDNLPPLTHPRHLGTFPRFLGTYARDEQLLTWPEAVHKLTGLAADALKLEDRGVLRPGAFADVVVFDPETIDGVATFENPFRYAVGIRHVFVNGVATVRDGEPTPAVPGRALRGPGWAGGAG